MADRLTTFAWRHSKRDQIVVVILTLISFPIMWITLELPKVIINDAIDGRNFPRVIVGFELEQVQYLLALCLAYLGAVALNNVVKYVVNIRRGLTGERMLRRMRFELFQRVMARPLHRLRSTSPGELVQLVSAELAPIGDFIGAIFATPMMAGGQFLVYLGFILYQNALLGAAALFLYPVQAYVIPKLQARVIAMIRERLANIRAMAREINESIDGAVEVRALRTRRWHMAIVSQQLYDNFRIRQRIFVLKFLIKFLNNVADHITPFFIFLIGGYFVIEGQLDIGALTAVLIAYKDLSSPWKDLLRFYQDFSDMSARYQDVMDQFREDGAPEPLPETAPTGEDAVALHGARVEGIARPVTCGVPKGAVAAVYDRDPHRRLALLQALSGISDSGEGRWTAAQPLLYRSAVLVTPDSRPFAGSFRSNMLQGLQFRPVEDAHDPGAEARRREARITGAPEDDIAARWIDPVEAGYPDMDAVEDRILSLAHALSMDDDLYTIGLGSRADPKERPDLTGTLLDLRRVVARSEELGAMREDFIDVWRQDRYNPNGTVGENLFFARPADPSLRWADFAGDRAVLRAVEQAGLRPMLTDIGADLCETLLSLFGGVAGDSDLLREYGLFSRSETPFIEATVRKARRRGIARLNRAETQRLIAVAFDYCSARYRLSVLRGKGREKLLVEARPRMRRALGGDPRFVFFEEDAYIPPFSLSENLFFGPVRVDRRDSWKPFKARIDILARETGLREEIMRLGLDQPVGDGGVTLNARQRGRLALGRALMKNPGALLLEQIAASDSEEDKALRRLLHRELGGGALVHGISRPEAAEGADLVIWVDPDDGGVVKQGSCVEFRQLDGGESKGR